MTPRLPTPHGRRVAAAFAALLAAAAAQADGGRRMPANVPMAYSQECGACHVVYPPALLPAASWRRQMAGLDKHYGSDASIDTASAQQIGAWLQAHAGTYKRVREEPPQDRITRAAWFARKHDGIDSASWRLPAVKSAANCNACHPGAERGDYEDDAVRMPAGATTNRWRFWRHD